VSGLDAPDVLRLLLLESALRHLTDAGVIDQGRVLDGLIADLAADLEAAIAQEDANQRTHIAQQLEDARRHRANGDRHAPTTPVDADTALEDAYRCLAALRRLELEN
jgi:hypothetical protein